MSSASDERLRVYLTNSLEQAEQPIARHCSVHLRAITDEANAAAAIKRDLPIMVVLGNPPYSGSSANDSRRDGKLTWIGTLIEDYKQVDGHHFGESSRNWLHDDYVKFIRFGQWRIRESGSGILAFITNHGYLDNPTFRGMRQQLLDTFTDIYVIDLHGNTRTRELSPDGSADENVFDIQQGVAISIFVKEPGKHPPAAVRRADWYGIREAKYARLSELDISTTDWEVLAPESPAYRFKPWNDALEREYLRWPKVNTIMPINSTGIQTSRDRLTIRWSPDDVKELVHDFASMEPHQLVQKYRLPADGRNWKVAWAKDDVVSSGAQENMVSQIVYRPFDLRFTYYTGKTSGLMSWPRPKVLRNMVPDDNLALTFTRQASAREEYLHFGVVRNIVDLNAYNTRGGTVVAPLYTYPTAQQIASGLYAAGHREPNLSPATDDLAQRTGLTFIPDGPGDLQDTFGPGGRVPLHLRCVSLASLPGTLRSVPPRRLSPGAAAGRRGAVPGSGRTGPPD